MKDEIKLSDKFTLIGVEDCQEVALRYCEACGYSGGDLAPDSCEDCGCRYIPNEGENSEVCPECGSSEYENHCPKCDSHRTYYVSDIEYLHLLGTWEQFSNSPDAEERARQWCEVREPSKYTEGGSFRDYCENIGGSKWYDGSFTALDSLHSAVKQITGDIFVIREEKE